MTKLIIFDLDGTLLDTIEDIANSTNYALIQHNFPTHPIAVFNNFIGNGLTKLIERALPNENRNLDCISMVKAEFIKHYATHSEEYTKPYYGISELVNKLNKEGYLLAIASNKVHIATVNLAKKFFPEIDFISVLGQREGYPIKPNSAILDEIIHLAGVSKTDVLYVGDSGVDAATAYNAKVPFVGVLWGFRPRKELEEVGATVFVENTEELYRIIKA